MIFDSSKSGTEWTIEFALWIDEGVYYGFHIVYGNKWDLKHFVGTIAAVK